MTTAQRIQDEEEEQDDEEDDDTDLAVGEIKKNTFDFCVESLHQKWKSGELEVQPVYQRDFMWNIKQCSELVRTVLRGSIVPTIYLYERHDRVHEVIDGRQRLTALFSFIEGKFAEGQNQGEEFKLQGLEQNKKLNGMGYQDLSLDQQRQFRNYVIHCVVVLKENDANSVFFVYQDINRKGTELTDQQIRRCSFHGTYIQMLDQLVEDGIFSNVVDDKKFADTVSRCNGDRELILRLIAMWRNGEDYRGPLVSFLNQEIDSHRNMGSDEIKSMTQRVRKTMTVINRVFQKEAFRYYNKKQKAWKLKAVQPQQGKVTWQMTAIWDTIYTIIARKIDLDGKYGAQLDEHADTIREVVNQLMQVEEFQKQCRLSKPAFIYRKHIIEKAFQIILSNNSISAQQVVLQIVNTSADVEAENSVDIVLDEERSEWKGRTFPTHVKSLLYEDGCKCMRCGNLIRQIEDAEVDHVIPFSRGGKTNLENAQLMHTWCNRRKGNNIEQIKHTTQQQLV